MARWVCLTTVVPCPIGWFMMYLTFEKERTIQHTNDAEQQRHVIFRSLLTDK